MIDVGVAVNVHFGTRQAAAVDQAGVVFGVGVDRVLAIHQCGHRAEVGGEAGGEHQCGFGAFELGQAPFQFGVRGGMAGDERAGSGAPAFLLGGFAIAAAARRGSAARPR